MKIFSSGFWLGLLAGFLRFFIKRNPVGWLSSKFNRQHPYWAAAISAVTIISLLLSTGWFIFWRGAEKTQAAWWNDMWPYRKAVVITNSSGSNLTDFQVKVLSNVDLSSDIAVGKIKSDLGDLRFTDTSGNILPYWIEDATINSVDVWVKVQSLPSSGATFYMYYGNPSAVSQSNGEAVFEFFDDFSKGADKWTNQAGAAFTTVSSNGNMVGSYTRVSGSTWPGSFAGDETLGNVAVETKINVASGGRAGVYIRHLSSTDTDNGYYLRIPEDTFGFTTNSAVEAPLGSYVLDNNTWYKVKITIYGTTANFFMNDVDQNLPRTVQNSTGSIGVTALDDSGPVYLDDFRVRKFASVDPTAAAPSAEEKGSGPVAYWSFDEGYGTTAFDATANKNNGTLTNMSATASSTSGWQTEDACVSGKCLAFDGVDDYVAIGARQFGANSGSVSIWVKPLAGLPSSSMIFGHQNGDNRLYIGSDAWPRIKLGLADNGGIDSGQDISYGVWQHINLVYDSGAWFFYYNGKQVSSGSYSGSIVFSSPEIGDDGGSSWNGNFKGLIDEMKIYNYARSAEQIKMDYNVGLAGQGGSGSGNEGAGVTVGQRSPQWLSNGLVGYWKMDESSWNGTAGEVVDWSGNGRNATSINGALITGGKFGNGGSFDGDNDEVNFVPYTFGNGNWTVSAWVKTADSDGGIIGPDSGGLATNTMGIISGKIWYYNYDGNWQSHAGTTGISDGKWHFLTWVNFSNQTMNMYVDGNLESGSGFNSYTTNGGPVNSIGRSWSLALNGIIDEVRFYNRALLPREIKDLHSFAPGPVGYWKMDEGNGQYAYDSSGNQNAGTLGAAATAGADDPVWTTGKIGKALKFDGSNDYVAVADNPALRAGNAMTISFWVNGKKTAANQQIIKKYDDANNSYQIAIGNTGAEIYTYFRVGGTTYEKGGFYKLPENQWTQVTITFSGGTTTFYINGIKFNEYGVGGALGMDSSTTNLFLGAAQFGGLLDEVRIYNYVRTAGQIMEDMNARGSAAEGGGAAVSASGKTTVGYWKFDEGQGTTVYDSSSNKNSGTMYNMASPATATSGWSNNGKFGRALSFDGDNDYISVADSSSLDATDGLTISLWVRPASSMSGISKGLLGKYEGSAGQRGYMIRANDVAGASGCNNVLAFILSATGGTTFNSRCADMALAANKWYHIVTVFKGGTNQDIYIDGKLHNGGFGAESTGSIPSAINVNLQPLLIGKIHSGEYFPGLIDEVKIYNFALTVDEVNLDYNQGAALKLGSVGTDAAGNPSNAADRAYCPPGDTTAACGPVGEWRFEEGSGQTAKDTSGSGNNGVIGALTSIDSSDPVYTTGRIGKALKFDGVDDYVISKNANLSFTDAITIEAWVKPTVTDTYMGIVSRTDLNNHFGDFDIHLSNNGQVRFILNDDSPTNRLDSSALVAGQWSHIAVTYSNSSGYKKIYINGIENNSASFSGNINANYSNVLIGLYFSAQYPFRGNIDEVKIYNYARSAAQVAWDYNKGGPVGWWKMDECQGSAIHDSSGRNNVGTLNLGAGGVTSAGTCQTAGTAWGLGAGGKRNASLSFDGADDYVEIPDGPNLDISGELTISAWVKIAATDNTNYGGVGKYANMTGYANQRSYGFYFLSNSTRPSAGVSDNGTANSGHWTGVDSSTNIGLNTWAHVVMVFKPSAYLRIYINGKLDSETTSGVVSSIFNSTAPLWLGTNYDKTDSARNMNGQIDDVQIFNYALTVQQIKTLYSGGAVRF